MSARKMLTNTVGLTTLITLCLAPVLAAGQDPSSVQRFGFGSRAVGLGGAFVAMADDPSAVFCNPAGMTQLTHPALLLGYVDRFGLGVQDLHTGLVVPIEGRFGIGVGLTRVSVDDVMRVGQTGTDGRPTLVETIDNAQNVAVLSGAYAVTKMLSIGGGLRGYYNQLDGYSGKGVGLDAGVLLRATEFLAVGVAAQDISGTTIRWNSEGDYWDWVPQTVRGGVALSLLDNSARVSVQANRVAGEDITIQGGAEYWVRGRLALRAGLRDDSPSFGASARLDRIQVDYAYFSPDLGDCHILALLISL